MADAIPRRSNTIDEENQLSSQHQKGQDISQSRDILKISTLLAEEISGGKFDTNADSVRILAARVIAFKDSEAAPLLLDLLEPGFREHDPETTRALYFFREVATILQKNASLSIEALGSNLIEGSILKAPENESDQVKVKKLTFAAVGWITTLYEADYAKDSDPFAVYIRGSACESFQASSVDSSRSGRSIAELLFGFGEILPFPRIEGYQDEGQQVKAGEFHVASLNAATLRKVGHIQFEWTDTIGCHLEFDPAHLTIKLYRFPSLCVLHQTKGSVLIPLLLDYYGDTFKSKPYTVSNLASEIILSYSLLFRCDALARKEYGATWRAAAAEDNMLDPMLDKLCIGTRRGFRTFFQASYKQPLRETFDASSDFPILSARLRKIQRFSDSIQPNRMRSLWKDKRDIMRWYTFWAVVILGGVNLVVAVAQTGLSSAQVQLAREALELQWKGNN